MIETVTKTIYVIVATLGIDSQQLPGIYDTQLECEMNRPSNTAVAYTCERTEIETQYECGRPIYKERVNFWGNLKRTQVGTGCQRFSDVTGKRSYYPIWHKVERFD